MGYSRAHYEHSERFSLHSAGRLDTRPSENEVFVVLFFLKFRNFDQVLETL